LFFSNAQDGCTPLHAAVLGEFSDLSGAILCRVFFIFFSVIFFLATCFSFSGYCHLFLPHRPVCILSVPFYFRLYRFSSVVFLLQNGADGEIENEDGDCALDFAVEVNLNEGIIEGYRCNCYLHNISIAFLYHAAP
jgi:hypothetical protein